MWNYQVYGIELFFNHIRLHAGTKFISKLHILLGLTSILGIILWVFKKKFNYVYERKFDGEDNIKESKMSLLLPIIGLIFFVSLARNILSGLYFFHIPFTSWHSGALHNAPPIFYFGRLIEFSPFYIFSFITFFIAFLEEDKGALLRMSSMVILIFFVLWGSYQCRYILPSIPFLILLGVGLVIKIFDKILDLPETRLNRMKMVLFYSVLVYAFIKTMYLNFILSFPNNVCYF